MTHLDRDFCSGSPMSSSLVMFPSLRNFDSAELLCSVLGGDIATPANKEENDLVYRESFANFSVGLKCNELMRHRYSVP